MTKQEVVKVVTLIVMSYPAAERFKDEAVLHGMTSVWAQMFKDDNPRLVELAVQRHIATSKWSPSIAEIREQILNIQHPELIPPDLAWAAIVDRLQADGRWVEDVEGAFPPLIAQVVQTIGWETLYDMHRGQSAGYRNGQDKQTFLELYRPAYERARERAMLPKALSDALQNAERLLGSDALRMLESAKESRVEAEKKYSSIGAMIHETAT